MSGHVPTRRARRDETGFTLIEILVVLVITAILLGVALMALRQAQVGARYDAMKASSASVAQALSAYNRMRPPVGGTDPLMAQGTWTSTQTEAAGGLYSITGERLLSPWPDDPYTGAPIRIVRARGGCPGTAPRGTVVVCRLGAAASRSSFRVIGGGTNRGGQVDNAYDQSFG